MVELKCQLKAFEHLEGIGKAQRFLLLFRVVGLVRGEEEMIYIQVLLWDDSSDHDVWLIRIERE